MTTSHSWGVRHLHTAEAKLQKVLNSLMALQPAPAALDGFDHGN